MESQDNKKIFIFSIVFAVIFIVSLLIFISRRPSRPITSNPGATPTQIVPTRNIIPTDGENANPSPTITFNPDGPQVGQDYVNIEPTMETVDLAIAELSKKTHYEGKYFKMDYVPETDTYNVVIQQANKEAGDAEFDKFLKDKGIPNRTDIRRLNVGYE